MKIQFTPVGVSFDDVPQNIKLLSVGSKLDFLHVPAFYGSGEKRKEYPNAIAVMFGDKKVGALAESSDPDSPQQSILRLIKDGKPPNGTVIEIMVPSEVQTFKMTYKIEVEVPEYKEPPKDTVSEVVKLTSFNEEGVVVDFNKTTHKYEHNGVKLTGASSETKKFTQEFNAEMVAKNCENSWGVPASDIVSLWESNAEVATEFGTVIHKLLEHHEQNKERGARIKTSRGTSEDPSRPKHPILGGIIDGFERVSSGDTGKVYSEVLVTSVRTSRCGQIDRLLVIDEKKKICRVQDYKVNVGAEELSAKNKLKEPYKDMPANKLSKYTLQLNFYAQILEESGWTVGGIDVYVLEDEWKKFELNRIII